jgi:uncharacterized delta-60 repeat protein
MRRVARRWIFSCVGVIVAVGVTLLASVSAAPAAPGDLDPSFGNGGIVLTGRVLVISVAVQPDGRIVGAGPVWQGGDEVDWGLVRYNADGTIDSSFGDGGVVMTDFGGNYDYPNELALQPDGKVVVAGYVGDVSGEGRDFGVARYNIDGSLDAGFGTRGVVTTDLGGIDNSEALLLEPDGKIVLAGLSGDDVALARYTVDGMLDTGFGGGGTVTAEIEGAQFVGGLVAQDGGRILVVGNTGFDVLLARFTADGVLDAGFGAGGLIIHDVGVGNHVYDAVVRPDGRIVAVGPTVSLDFMVVGFRVDGTLDDRFGVGGLVTTSFFGDDDIPSAVKLQPDGAILVAGLTATAGGDDSIDEDYALARYLPDGTLDAGFGSGGVVTTDINGDNDGASALALQPDGRIVVAGIEALVRYLPDGPVIPPTVAITGGRCPAHDQVSGIISLRVDPAEATVTATSSNQTLVPDANLIVSGTGQDRELRITAAPELSGTATVTVRAEGDDGTGSLAIEVAVGTARPDTLPGGDGHDLLFGREQADTLTGLGGTDLLCGGNGTDHLDGGDHDDGIFGQNGKDRLSGGPGADLFSGGPGVDTVVDLNPAEGDRTT